MRPRLPFIFALLASFCALSGHDLGRAVDGAENPPGQRVFVMGHSFHVFLGWRLAVLAKAAGIEGHQQVGTQAIGGSRVQQHWDLPDDKNKAKAALKAGEVDVLTMSPNWIVPDEGIDRFVELGLQHNPKLRVLVQESWMPWDGWLPNEKVSKNEDRDARSLDIVRGANTRFKNLLEPPIRALNEKLGREVITVVPVGDAVLKLRDLIEAGKAPGITKHSELFTDPIGHAKSPVVALAAYCTFACLYRRSPVGLQATDAALDSLSPDLRPLLQRLAWEAVTEHPLSGVKSKPTP